MNKDVLVFGVSSMLIFLVQSREFEIINNTQLPLKIIWKSNGIGPEIATGDFEVQPAEQCQACIETNKNNCIHILSIETVSHDTKTYKKVFSRPFCKDSKIIVSLQEKKNIFGISTKKLIVDVKTSIPEV